jgi:4-diphosphocytidyl-2-C-methyl-D-erythritol kinase
MEVTAPAKLNLYLGITGRREDGYHEIETLFEKISISDRIKIDISAEGDKLTSSEARVPLGEDSLLGKTISAFRDASGEGACFRVDLEKNIPLSAGLGGGSSDAAALLKGLNALTGHPLDKDALMRIAALLGADVPFFIEEAPFALGRGRGDIIETVETGLDLSHVVINPPLSTSTKEIYGKVTALNLTKHDAWDRMLTSFLIERDIESIARNLRNDLQQIVLQEFPVLDRMLSALRSEGAKASLMSGSGPTVFGIFDRDRASEAAAALKKDFPVSNGWRIYTAYTYVEEKKDEDHRSKGLSYRKQRRQIEGFRYNDVRRLVRGKERQDNTGH